MAYSAFHGLKTVFIYTAVWNFCKHLLGVLGRNWMIEGASHFSLGRDIVPNRMAVLFRGSFQSGIVMWLDLGHEKD